MCDPIFQHSNIPVPLQQDQFSVVKAMIACLVPARPGHG